MRKMEKLAPKNKEENKDIKNILLLNKQMLI